MRITLRTGSNNLCPYGMLRISSGCRPSHLPLAKARAGISGGFLTKQRRHSLHIGAGAAPSHMASVTRRLCSSKCFGPDLSFSNGHDCRTSLAGTSCHTLLYVVGSNRAETSSSFFHSDFSPAIKVGISSSDQRLSAHTTQATYLRGPHLSPLINPLPCCKLSCMFCVKPSHMVAPRT